MNEAQSKAAEEIIHLERESCRTMLAGDLKWNTDVILSKHTLQFPPGYPMLDRDGYLAWLEEFLSIEGAAFSWEPTQAIVSESLDMAYCYGTTLLKMPGQVDQQGKYVSVWIKEDGAWKVALEINNFNA